MLRLAELRGKIRLVPNWNTLPARSWYGWDVKTSDALTGHRVLILTGEHDGEEGICLGRIAGTNRWAVSPDASTAILELHFEDEFALLLDLSAAPAQN